MKLPNSYGSVYKLSGKRRNPYVARKTIGWNVQENGKVYPKYLYVGYYKTKKEALEALAEYNRNPQEEENTKYTVAEIYEKWSVDKYEKIAVNTKRIYKMSYNNIEPLHSMQISALKLDNVQQVFDDLNKNKQTLKQAKTLLHQLMDYAIAHEYIKPDRKAFLEFVAVDKNDNTKHRERKIFTDKEIKFLWERHLDDEPAEILIMLIYSGVRISELLNIKLENINLEKQYFEVRKSKTEAGVRQVPIADAVMPIYKRICLRNKKYLIESRKGLKRAPVNFTRDVIKPYCMDHELEHTTHDTRHTCITLLTEAGVSDKIIKSIVGHKGSGVTEQVYTHIRIEKKLEAINKITPKEFVTNL